MLPASFLWGRSLCFRISAAIRAIWRQLHECAKPRAPWRRTIVAWSPRCRRRSSPLHRALWLGSPGAVDLPSRSSCHSLTAHRFFQSVRKRAIPKRSRSAELFYPTLSGSACPTRPNAALVARGRVNHRDDHSCRSAEATTHRAIIEIQRNPCLLHPTPPSAPTASWKWSGATPRPSSWPLPSSQSLRSARRRSQDRRGTGASLRQLRPRIAQSHERAGRDSNS